MKSSLQSHQNAVKMTGLAQEWEQDDMSQSTGESGTQLAWRTGTESEEGRVREHLGELCEASGGVSS